MISPSGARQRPMEHDRLQAVNQCICSAAQQAAAPGGLSALLIERFLRSGDETWEGAGSGRFSLAQFKEDEAYTRATKTALRTPCWTFWRICFRQKPSRFRRCRETRFGSELSRW